MLEIADTFRTRPACEAIKVVKVDSPRSSTESLCFDVAEKGYTTMKADGRSKGKCNSSVDDTEDIIAMYTADLRPPEPNSLLFNEKARRPSRLSIESICIDKAEEGYTTKKEQNPAQKKRKEKMDPVTHWGQFWDSLPNATPSRTAQEQKDTSRGLEAFADFWDSLPDATIKSPPRSQGNGGWASNFSIRQPRSPQIAAWSSSMKTVFNPLEALQLEEQSAWRGEAEQTPSAGFNKKAALQLIQNIHEVQSEHNALLTRTNKAIRAVEVDTAKEKANLKTTHKVDDWREDIAASSSKASSKKRIASSRGNFNKIPLEKRDLGHEAIVMSDLHERSKGKQRATSKERAKQKQRNTLDEYFDLETTLPWFDELDDTGNGKQKQSSDINKDETEPKPKKSVIALTMEIRALKMANQKHLEEQRDAREREAQERKVEEELKDPNFKHEAAQKLGKTPWVPPHEWFALSSSNLRKSPRRAQAEKVKDAHQRLETHVKKTP